MRHVIPPRQAWHRLTRMQQLVAQQPALARAVSYMPLYDQLDLTLELVGHHGNGYLDEDPVEPWPPNVIAFESVGLVSGGCGSTDFFDWHLASNRG